MAQAHSMRHHTPSLDLAFLATVPQVYIAYLCGGTDAESRNTAHFLPEESGVRLDKIMQQPLGHIVCCGIREGRFEECLQIHYAIKFVVGRDHRPISVVAYLSQVVI
jgi:hypothetical protein